MEKTSPNNFSSHLSFLKKLSSNHTPPPISLCEFLKSYEILFLEFDSFINGWMWIGKHSIILSCTWHSLKKILPISIHKFCKPYELLFLEFESFVKGWMWIGKNSPNNFIWLQCTWVGIFHKKIQCKKTYFGPILPSTDTNNLWLSLYLFLEFESFIKAWMWIGKKLT